MFTEYLFTSSSPLLSSKGWKWHSSSCYWVGEDLLTFDDARKSCEDHKAALVTITNRYTHTHISQENYLAVIKWRHSVFCHFGLKSHFVFKGSTRPLQTACCGAALEIPFGSGSMTRPIWALSTGSAEMRCPTPTGIETSLVGNTLEWV